MSATGSVIRAAGLSLLLLGCGAGTGPAVAPADGATATGGAAGTPGGSGGDNGSGGAAGTPGGSGGATSASGGSSGGDAATDAVTGEDGVGGDTGPLPGGGYAGADKLTCVPGTAGNGNMDLTGGLQADPPEWRLGAGVKAGTLTASKSFASAIYGQHFPYRVYASANVVKGQPAVFMTFGDGGEYISGFHTPTVLDNLTATGDVPPTVVLFIDPPSDGDRVKTYDPPTDKYSRFLMQEIIPAVITPDFTISQDPAAWATGGHSASAEQDWTVLWTTDHFHKFLGHNSSFGAAPTYGVDWAMTIMAAPMRDLRVSLVAAAVGKDLVDQRGDWTRINQGVAMALQAKGVPTRFIIGPGDHGGPASQRDFPTALRWAFRGCKFAP